MVNVTLKKVPSKTFGLLYSVNINGKQFALSKKTKATQLKKELDAFFIKKFDSFQRGN